MLSIGRGSSGELAFIRHSGTAPIAIVPADAVELLLAGPAHYWNNVLLDFPLGATFTRRVIQTPMETVLAGLTPGDDRWMLASPVQANVDEENLQRILGRLRHLEARQMVALGETVPEIYEQGADIINVAVEAQLDPNAPDAPALPETVMYVLKFTRMLGKTYAWIDEQQPIAIGEFPRQLFDEIRAELRYRTVLTIDPQEITYIGLSAGEDSFALARSPGQSRWFSTTDPQLQIDGEKVREFLEAIRQIQAVRFVNHTATNLADFAPAGPWLVLELGSPDRQRARIAILSQGDADGKYAAVEGLPGVFVLSDETLALLARPLGSFAE